MDDVLVSPVDSNGSDELWLLPPGWKWTKIDSVLAPMEDGRILHHGWSPQCEAFPSENVEIWGVLKTTAVQAGDFLAHENKVLPDHLDPRKNLEVRAGDLLLTCAGPRSRCGVACLVRETRPRLIFSGKMYRFRTAPTVMDAAFLEAFLQTSHAWRAIDEMKTGGSDSGLNLTHDRFRQLLVPVAPLPEQRRVVARLDELLTKISEGEAALAEARKGLDIFRRALLKAAVTGELTRDWRAANPAPETGHDLLARIAGKRATNEAAKRRFRRADDVKFLDVTALPMIPETWTWTTLGALFDISTGSTPSRTEPAFWGGDIPWVSSGEVAFCRIRSTRETISAAGLGNPTTRLNPIGTVLLAMIGEGKTRGQCAILDVPAANNQNAAAIRVAGTPIPPEFVYHVLEERYFTSRRESQGGNQPALNAGKVADMPIPLPPLREIDEILRCVSESTAACADTLAMLDAEATDAARLKQSILKAAFEGRLVPQEATDKPVSALLARLAADRSDVSGKRGRAKSARSKGLASQ